MSSATVTDFDSLSATTVVAVTKIIRIKLIELGSWLESNLYLLIFF